MVRKETVSYCLVCDSNDSEIIESTLTMMAQPDETWHFRKCKECAMVFLSPRVSIEVLNSYYTDSYLPYRGASAWGKFEQLVEGDQKKVDIKRLKTVETYLPSGGKSILDIGCGKPSFLKVVQETLGLQAFGLDFSDKGWIDEAGLYDNINLHIGDIQQLPKDTKADIVTMWHYLEHDYNPKETLSLLSDKLDAGSLLVIEVPNHDSYSRKKHGKYWSGYHTPRHTGLYTPSTMKRLLESSGWKIVDQYSYGTLDPYTLDWMSRMERRTINWNESMEQYFMGYVTGKLTRPRYYFDKMQSLGFMTAIARNVKK